ncbi:uncharacterized protein LOC121383763 [Gigantopelta aegis]|uniref:uncharacterized protein LOC121383763 n=1 Tax=Gigantopelta aegis TaxID=1735272 RepID=UPI001B88B8CD|nr:uncharacterized protein LOC121383763 [Gigantopelta aegis]
MNNDSFFFDVSTTPRSFIRRGVLSVVNSLFDPIGFLAPITIQGKLILRNLMNGTTDWDEPLPPDKLSEWVTWKDSLVQLKHVHIPRCYSTESLSQASKVELHVFCDASEFAIAAVSYLVIYSTDYSRHISFVMGKAKVAPASGHTIPRLELCAAVLAVQISEIVMDNIGIKFHDINYYSDSRIVLGYLYNISKRFMTYVSNRVEKVRKINRPDQWNYISTQLNPADIGTRGIHVDKIQDSLWLVGRVVEVFPSQDGKMRKIKVAISRNGKLHYYIRPIVNIVLLVTNDSYFLNNNECVSYSIKDYRIRIYKHVN